MEKESTLKETIAIAVGCVVLGVVYSFVEHSLFSIILFGIAAAAIIVVYVLRQTVWKSIETLEKDICKQLDKSGFRYAKKEGDLYVVKDNCHFQIQLADSYNRGIKHLYVMYKFRDDNSNKVTIDGWSRASNVINTRNTNTWRIIFAVAIRLQSATPGISCMSLAEHTMLSARPWMIIVVYIRIWSGIIQIAREAKRVLDLGKTINNLIKQRTTWKNYS